MYLLKGLELILLLLVVSETKGVEEPVDTLSSSDQTNLMQLIFEERLQRLLLEQRLEAKVQEVLDTNRVLQTNMNNMTEEILNNKKQVAFSGRIGRHILISEKGRVVKFAVLTTNVGNAYSTTTGIFRCPVSGLYLFSCNILGSTPGFVVVNIYQNRNIIARPHSGASGVGGHDTGSDTAVVHANKGDEIYVEFEGGTSKYLDHMSRCSGVLLKTD